MNKVSIQQQLIEYSRVIAQYKWPTLIAASALMLMFTVIVTKLPNEYEATTTILFDPQQVSERYITTAVSDTTGRLNIITQELLSTTRLQEIIAKFKLYKEAGVNLPQQQLVEKMRKDIGIQVRQGVESQLSTFTISFQSRDQAVVADVANELADSFIRWNVNSRTRQIEGTQESIFSELQAGKKNLEEQEKSLREFKTSHLGETPDQRDTNLQAIVALRSTLQANSDACDRLEQEQLLLTRVPQTVGVTGSMDTGLATVDPLEEEKLQLESELRRLRGRYSDSYPDVLIVRHRLEYINRQLGEAPPDVPRIAENPAPQVSANSIRVELVKKQLARLRAEQEHIRDQIRGYQQKLDAIPMREQQLLELTRNYDVSKQHYQTILDKSFNIEMAASVEQKQKTQLFTVLDPARKPEKPVRPNRKVLLPLAVLASAILACLSVVGKELLKATVGTEAELKSIVPTRVQILATLPRIEIPDDRSRSVAVGLLAVAASVPLWASTLWMVWQMRRVL